MESSNNDNDTTLSLLPIVVACGYRYIKIDKSGNKFPAYLIALPSGDNDGGFVLVWRSKKDFLLLSRAFTNNTTNLFYQRLP